MQVSCQRLILIDFDTSFSSADTDLWKSEKKGEKNQKTKIKKKPKNQKKKKKTKIKPKQNKTAQKRNPKSFKLQITPGKITKRVTTLARNQPKWSQHRGTMPGQIGAGYSTPLIIAPCPVNSSRGIQLQHPWQIIPALYI